MARTRFGRRTGSQRAIDTLLEKGLIAVAIGAGMLLAPWLAAKSPMLATLAKALRPAGWLALALGAALLVAYGLLRKRQAAAPLDREAAPKRPRAHPAPRPALEADRRDHSPNAITQAHADPEMAPAAAAPEPPAAPATYRAAASFVVCDEARGNRAAAPLAKTQWGADVFAAIEWRRFEAVCEALFAQAGFETRSQSHGADGGVDIWLHSRHSTGPVSVVQCKHWQGKAVGVKQMREFFGVMASHHLARGTYATTSTYTSDAQEFAKANGIHTLDGAGLLALIAKRTPAQQQALLEVAFEGDYARPTCASCGTKMVERKHSATGNLFWGCTGYPRCRRTMPMALPR